ncbi:MAG: histidine kinase dimerization/phosphoacceptor domain -containing protein [Saprospiraceae bacterium]
MKTNLFFTQLRYLVLACFSIFYLVSLNGQVDTVAIMEKIKSDYSIALKLQHDEKYDEAFQYLKEINALSDSIGQVTPKFTIQLAMISSIIKMNKLEELDKLYKEMELNISKVSPYLQCFYWYDKANYLYQLNRFEESKKNLLIGKKLLDKSFVDFPDLFVRYLDLESDIASQNKNYSYARDLLNTVEDSLKSQTFAIKNRDKSFFNLYNSLAILSKDISDFNSAHQYYSMALTYASSDKEKNVIKYNIALLLFKEEKNNEALTLLNEIENENKSMYTSTKLRILDLRCQIYERLNDQDKFISEFEKLKKQGTKEDFKPLMINFDLLEAIKQYYLGNYNKSIELCNTAIENYKMEEESFQESMFEAKKYLALSKAKQKDSDLLIEDFNNLVSQNDSLNELKISNEVNKLNIYYQTKQKEADNIALKEQQSLQQSIISEQKKILLGGSFGLGIISILSLLLYRLSYKRKLMNQTLSQQKDKIQLLNRELNHRVKNNLAFMTSLLEMQGRRTESEETRQALIESEARLKALSLVHSQLFKSDADTEVNLKDYLEEIKENLLHIFSIPGKKLNIITDFCDYNINAEDAMRLGLIVNESITNSVKHAFADVANPEIKISTSINPEGKLSLYYSDNGPGITMTLDEKESSLGRKLIELLKKQLGDRYVFMMY